MKKEKTEHDSWVEKYGHLVRDCTPLPQPEIFTDPYLKTFSPNSLIYCENGVVRYLAPDMRFHFFKILLHEEELYERRKKSGSLLGPGVISLN